MPNSENPPTAEEIIAKSTQTPLGELMTNDTKRRSMIFEQLAQSQNPLLAEMGRELKTGRMSLLDTMQHSAYAEQLLAAEPEPPDTSTIAAELEKYVSQPSSNTAAPWEEDDDEDFSQQSFLEEVTDRRPRGR